MHNRLTSISVSLTPILTEHQPNNTTLEFSTRRLCFSDKLILCQELTTSAVWKASGVWLQQPLRCKHHPDSLEESQIIVMFTVKRSYEWSLAQVTIRKELKTNQMKIE